MEKNIILQERRYTIKGTLLGIGLTLFCNCIFLTTCTLVKEYKLQAAEVCFIRGLLQVFVFLVLYLVLNHCKRFLGSNHNITKDKFDVLKSDNIRWYKNFDWKLTLVVCFCGLSFGLMTLLSYIGVKLIPLSHFVVFGHTAPVFTLILSALILRYKSLLKTILHQTL